MKIAIIGVGNIGGTLAKAWLKSGHKILLGVRDLESDGVQGLLSLSEGVSAKPIYEAAQEAEVILIAVPSAAVFEVVKNMGYVADKVIIDAMNSVGKKPEPFANTTEAIRHHTRCRHLVKCFNSTGWENIANPMYGDTAIDMFMAGSSEKGKQVAAQLSKEAGFAECYDIGGDDKVQLLEDFALFWINLAIMQRQGRNIAFKLLRRP
ncbi:MAG TPA: NAD(P)-binding domain-containing protein [Chitinophagales bacterium]|nr:NAD(P)-binding domain-containing protein [Chitinophagales bacterium]HRK29124.1 NAD(P)-binding domain-containing protein [Chitinophagales bacterium]